eukprot:10477253-Alexandrium_andersonii.AAC.1
MASLYPHPPRATLVAPLAGAEWGAEHRAALGGTTLRKWLLPQPEPTFAAQPGSTNHARGR